MWNDIELKFTKNIDFNQITGYIFSRKLFNAIKELLSLDDFMQNL